MHTYIHTGLALAVMTMGNILIEQLRCNILDPLVATSAELSTKAGKIGSRDVDGDVLQHLNNMHYSTLGTRNMRTLVERGLDAKFVNAARGLVLELEDISSSLNRIMHDGVYLLLVHVYVCL
jgi:hypothetical protein